MGHISIYLTLWRTTKLCFIGAAPFCILINSTLGTQFIHWLALISFSFFDSSYPCRCEVVCHLICIPLMTNEFKHLFMCFLDICISLEKYLFKAFAYFSISLLGFLLLNCRISLHILDCTPLSDICMSFLPFCCCLFTSWIVFFHASVLNCIVSVFFFRLLPVLLVLYLRNHCQIQGYEKFPLCFPLRGLKF